MRKLSLLLAAVLAVTAWGVEMSKSVPKGWGEDFEAAKTQAAQEGKFVLLAFSGSDWCHWCVKMEQEVFSQPYFVQEASKKYVLVMADCPRDESILSPLAKKQNRALARQFAVRGFPSTIILDAKGKELKRHSGYVRGGAKGGIAFLDELMKGVAWPQPVKAVK